MIVTCPNCAKRYMLDDALLFKDGRQVRCITCQHIWRQKKEECSYQTTLPLAGVSRDASIAFPHPKEHSSRKLFLLTLGLIIVFIIFLIMGRHQIVPSFPSLERYYDLLGLPVNLAGSDISISNTNTQFGYEGDQKVIHVSGDLQNTSNRVRHIPTLKITVLGNPTHPLCKGNLKDKGCILEEWYHRLSESSLLPGEQIHFETTARPVSEGITHVSIEF